jgi:hypothetical protein
VEAFNPDERFDDPESVEVLLPIARDILEEERARARHLDQKGGALAGFTAISISLEAGLAPTAYDGKLLDCQSEAVFTVMFALAIGSLLTAAALAILGVLSPKDQWGVTDEQIDAYSDRPKVITPVEDLRMAELRTLTEIARRDRRTVDKKAQFLKFASLALGLGVLGISGQALTIAFS